MAELSLYLKVLFKQISPSNTGSEYPIRFFNLNGATYLAIKTFTLSDSNKITAGIQTPDKFIFTVSGNIYINNSMIFNNISISNSEFDLQGNSPTIKSLSAEYKNIYKYNNNNVISENLLWILHKDSSNIWRILYNPIHSANFKEYYNEKYKNNNNSNGLPKYQKNVCIDIPSKLNDIYGPSLIIKDTRGDFYLDPTIMLMSLKLSQYSYIFNDNVANRTIDEKDADFTKAMSNIGFRGYCSAGFINTFALSIFGVLDQRGMPASLKSDSFIPFLIANNNQSKTMCTNAISFNKVVCKNIINAAHNVSATDSQIVNQCSINKDKPVGEEIAVNPVAGSKTPDEIILPDPITPVNSDPITPVNSDPITPKKSNKTVIIISVIILLLLIFGIGGYFLMSQKKIK